MRGWTVAVAGLLMLTLAAGCVSTSQRPYDPEVLPPAVRSEGDFITPPPRLVEAPPLNLTRLEAPRLFLGANRPSCPEDALVHGGEPFRPATAAPHRIDYHGPYDCVLVAGLDAAIQGTSLSVRVESAIQAGLQMADATFVGDGLGPVTEFRVLDWEMTGPFNLTTAEPHAVTPASVDLPFSDVGLRVRVTGLPAEAVLANLTAESTLTGPATASVPGHGVVNGTLTVGAGVHGLGGSARLRIGHASYQAQGAQAAMTWHGVHGLRIADRSFSGGIGLHGTGAELSLAPRAAGGLGELRLDAIQAWRGGTPLLEAELAVEIGPDSITVRETSGLASLEGVQVRVGDPPQGANETLPLDGAELFLLGPAAAPLLLAVVLQGFARFFDAGPDDVPLQQSLSIAPGESATLSFDTAAGTQASVSSLNGGSWTGTVPASAG